MSFQSDESLEHEKIATQIIHGFLSGRMCDPSEEDLISERYAFFKTLVALAYFKDPDLRREAKKDFKRFEDLYQHLLNSLIHFDDDFEDLIGDDVTKSDARAEYLTKYTVDQLFRQSAEEAHTDIYEQAIAWPRSGDPMELTDFTPRSNDLSNPLICDDARILVIANH
jgi:hypothetical protein